MNEFDFRSKYIDIDEEEPTKKNPDDISFDEEDLDEEKPVRNKKGNNKKIIALIAIICAVVLLASVTIVGFFWYRSVDPPQATGVHIETDSFENPKIAKYGSTVTLSFSFDKEVANKPIVIIDNTRVEVFGEGKDFYAKYFVQMQGSDDKRVTFSIMNYKNYIGKTGPAVKETTDGSYVVIEAFH